MIADLARTSVRPRPRPRFRPRRRCTFFDFEDEDEDEDDFDTTGGKTRNFETPSLSKKGK